MRKWITFLLCLCFAGAVMAAPGDTLHEKRIKTDTASRIQTRSFSSGGLEQYLKSDDFQYERTTPEVLSWWDRLKMWFWNKVNELLHLGLGTLGGRAILIIAAVILLIYIAFSMAGADRGWLLEKKNNRVRSFQINEEEVHAIDFDRAIADAVHQNNYRVAVRMWYLMTLKKLADKGLIRWKPGKTNYDYIGELKDSSYAPAFTRLTNSFELFWYGERTPALSEYERVKDRFSSFNEQLS